MSSDIDISEMNEYITNLKGPKLNFTRENTDIERSATEMEITFFL